MSKSHRFSSLHKAVEAGHRVLNVGGICSFDAGRWHEAVLCHIHRMWDRKFVRPVLDLGGVTIEYDATKDLYFAYGKPMFELAPDLGVDANPLVVDSPDGASVRDALGRFAMDKGCQALAIYLPEVAGRMELWKTPDSNLLGVAATGIPVTRVIEIPEVLVVQHREFVPVSAAITATRRTTSSQQIPSA